MDLILWRHAEAAPESDDLDDLERPLTPKGERQAQRMADWLNQKLAHSTRILASPALRCQQTARCLGKTFETLGALGPAGGAEAMLAAARWPSANEPVVVVGHQPTLGVVAAMLVAELAQPWALKKGAVVWLRHRDRDGIEQVVLQAVLSPDLL